MAGQTAVPSRAHTCTFHAAPSNSRPRKSLPLAQNAVDPDERETSNERKIESSQQAPKGSRCLQLIARWSLGHLYKALIILNPAVPEVLCTIAAAPDCTGTSCRFLLVGQDTRLVLCSLPHCLSCSTRRDAASQPQEGK